MEKDLVIIEIGKFLMQIFWIISIFWWGYLIGQQKAYIKLIDRDYEKLEKKKEKIEETIKNLKTNM